MKRFIAIMALILCVCLCSCNTVQRQEDLDKSPSGTKTSMFILLEEESDCWWIVYHKDTKVMYAVSDGFYNGGTFTLLVNADGTPMVYGGGE